MRCPKHSNSSVPTDLNCMPCPNTPVMSKTVTPSQQAQVLSPRPPFSSPRVNERLSGSRSPLRNIVSERKRKMLSPFLQRLTPNKFQKTIPPESTAPTPAPHSPPRQLPARQQQQPTPPSIMPTVTSTKFESILDRPFTLWKELDSVFSVLIPEWNSQERGHMSHHLVHFLELKIGMDEYIPDHMLAPSPLVDQAWRALILETQLYTRVTQAIQDFHCKPHKMIHYSIFRKGDETKICRTQSLFQVYFRDKMPVEPERRDSPPPLPSTSPVPQVQFTNQKLQVDDDQSLDDAASVNSTLLGEGFI
jgi:hypothetical protein